MNLRLYSQFGRELYDFGNRIRKWKWLHVLWRLASPVLLTLSLLGLMGAVFVVHGGAWNLARAVADPEQSLAVSVIFSLLIAVVLMLIIRRVAYGLRMQMILIDILVLGFGFLLLLFYIWLAEWKQLAPW